MLMPPAKKPGRNDPCWCGSGKKYKQCHLKLDQEAARAAAKEAGYTAMPPPLPTKARSPVSLPPIPEPSPEEAAVAALYERFEKADLEGKVAIFVELVDQKQLTGDDAFEMLLSIREASNPAEDPRAREQFVRLVQRLKVLQPEVYEDQASFLLKALIEDAVADQDWDGIPGLLKALTEKVEAHPDDISQVIQMLLYHDQRQALLPVLRDTWPVVAASDELTPFGKKAVALTLLDVSLFNYLETAEQPRPDDPALTRGLPPEFSIDAEVLGPVLAHITAPEPGPWQPGDFDEAVDAETWETNTSLLLWDFVAERRRAASVPFARSDLAREPLLETLLEQIGGPAPEKSKQKKKKKKGPAEAARRLPLIPDRDKLDAKLGTLFDLLGAPEPYAVAALMELLPAYLHFLARLGLVHPTEMDEALTELRVLVKPTMEVFRSFAGDVHATRNVEAAWSTEALDALRRDPALEEARSRPLVLRPAAANPMANAPVYRLKVTYQLADDVWFIIDMPRDRTLHELHRAILDAANFDEDHLYSFYLSGRAWDSDTEYSVREARFSSRTKIGDVPLRLKQRFLYLYDYGDQHEFEVQLLGPSLEPGRSGSLRLVETHGTMPRQYGTWEEDEGDEVEEEAWDEEEDEWLNEADTDEEDE